MEPLFTTESDLDIKEYRRYARKMQGIRYYRSYFIYGVIFVWVLYAAMRYIRAGRPVIAIFMLLVICLSPVLVLNVARRQREKLFKELQERGVTRYEIRFCEDHLETGEAEAGDSMAYADLYAIKETPTNFYIETAPGQALIIQKKNCSEELIAFLSALKLKVKKKKR